VTTALMVVGAAWIGSIAVEDAGAGKSETRNQKPEKNPNEGNPKEDLRPNDEAGDN
jgi:hypothetical protein